MPIPAGSLRTRGRGRHSPSKTGYLGFSPFEAPATFSLLQYTELAEGVWYPMGGMYRAIESLTAIAAKLGVKFLYHCAVSEIKTDGSHVRSVVTEDGRESTVGCLHRQCGIPVHLQEPVAEEPRADQLGNKLYTCSTIMFYWGMDKPYPQIAHHNVFLGGDYRSSFENIFNKKDTGSLISPVSTCMRQARTEPEAAPNGQDTLYVLVPVGHLDEGSQQDWQGMLSRARRSSPSAAFERHGPG